jgi:hypothetical protein
MITARRVEEADGTIRMDWAPPAKPVPVMLIRDGVIYIGGTIDPGNGCNAGTLRIALAEWPRTAPLIV